MKLMTFMAVGCNDGSRGRRARAERQIVGLSCFYSQDIFKSLQPWRKGGKPASESLLSLGHGAFGSVRVAKMEGSFTRVAEKSVSLLDSSGTWSDKRAHSVWHEVEHSRHLIEKAYRARQSWDHICRVHDVFYDAASSHGVG